MDLNQFKNLIRVVPKSEALQIRDDYINKFIDVNKEHYKKYIATLQEYSDGICYTGYLWDCLKEPNIIDFQSINAYICQKISTFLTKALIGHLYLPMKRSTAKGGVFSLVIFRQIKTDKIQ